MKLSDLPLKVAADLQGTDEITLTDRDAGGTVIETGRVTLSELGASGLLGADGADGIQGIQGIPGNDGADSTVAGPQGIQGNDGADGSDATATATIAVADGSAMQVIINAGSVEVGQLFSLFSDGSIRRFEGGNVSRVISDLPQANPTGYATLVSVATAAKSHYVWHDGTDGATGICYSIDGGTPVYKASVAGDYNRLDVPHNNGAPFTVSIWPTDYVGSDGAVTSAALRAGNLTRLQFAADAGITSLDVSGLAALTELSCSGNQLTSLDVSGLTALTILFCENNQLTSLDVSGLTALTSLRCGNNQLTSLDVSGLAALDSLTCWSNDITNLDVSGLTALTQLLCDGNPITTLDLSSSTLLTYLHCSNTNITSLDVSGLTALYQLFARNAQLTSILATGVAFSYGYWDGTTVADNNLSEAALIAFVGSLATTTTGQIYYGGNPGSAAFETWLIANPTLDKGYVWVNN